MTTIYELSAFMAKSLELYSFFIWIRILLSWFNPFTTKGSLTYYFSLIVDPYLNLFRSKRFHVGMLDFSPVIAIGFLSLVQSILRIFSYYHTFRFAWVLQLLLRYIWDFGIQIFLFLIILVLLFRTLGSLFHSQGLLNMGRLADPLIYKMKMAFFPNRLVKDSLVCLLTLALAVLCYFASQQVLAILLRLTTRIGF